MTVHEVLPNDSYVDDKGDILPFADVASDLNSHPVSSVSIAQGMMNLEQWRKEQEVVKQGEAELRKQREAILMQTALENTGVYVTLEDHRKNQQRLADIVGDVSMYRGGEKGGYKSTDFRNRYEPHTADVERGARQNHRKLVNHDIPEIYQAKALKAAGFDEHDVEDDVNRMRVELMQKYGGPENKKARAMWRKQNQ